MITRQQERYLKQALVVGIILTLDLLASTSGFTNLTNKGKHMSELKEWEKRILKENAPDNLYVVSVGKIKTTARKVDNEYFNSITGEKLNLPNIYSTHKICNS